jgi:hypothetical protein
MILGRPAGGSATLPGSCRFWGAFRGYHPPEAGSTPRLPLCEPLRVPEGSDHDPGGGRQMGRGRTQMGRALRRAFWLEANRGSPALQPSRSPSPPRIVAPIQGLASSDRFTQAFGLGWLVTGLWPSATALFKTLKARPERGIPHGERGKCLSRESGGTPIRVGQFLLYRGRGYSYLSDHDCSTVVQTN